MSNPGGNIVRHQLRVALWNLEWTKPGSQRADIIRRHLAEADPDIICLSEAYADFLSGGYQVEAEEDYGYPIKQGRRKVLLWSKQPWKSCDRVGSPDLPPGRYVSAATETALGPIQATGVCIPWSGAHVTGGRGDRKRWEDHLSYIDGLAPLLEAEPTRPHILLGDFNQAVPRASQPIRAFDALTAALEPRFELATAGVRDSNGHHAIDHLAHTSDLTAVALSELPARDANGIYLSDHFGLVLEVKSQV